MVEWTTPFTIGITSGEYLPTPIIPVGIHSQTIGIIIPQSTYNVVVRTGLEPVPGADSPISYTR